MRRTTFMALAVVVLVSAACGTGARGDREDPAATLAAVQRAHEAYVAAINSNRLDRWLATLDDGVEYLVPNRAAVLGRDAVGQWASGYLQEVTIRWTKTVRSFTVSGDWAFGRYAYTASDSVIIRDPETEGGGTANDSGWGLVVYHRGTDGAWRVARANSACS